MTAAAEMTPTGEWTESPSSPVDTHSQGGAAVGYVNAPAVTEHYLRPLTTATPPDHDNDRQSNTAEAQCDDDDNDVEL